ncbi:hybrid sensor histidine kinase/response regulator [Phaeovulum vinaykumarii]|uniref:histidine kinase n=1 Tax=Phaeovulum vinaykumarii TaxID=407234 RepID=A0A1N7MM30_9RHOB|nr:PAS-domain containing protein [Phaeovulum vinaykumarii]SIS86991.1 Signal transduction histidine kinase [Phaeovulum vinaykumarii]SOC13344.1 signal transduction histidine kinase [Phaeovulum vinaykumarii]
MGNDDGRERLIQAGLNLIQQALSIFDSDLRLAAANRPYQVMFDLPDALTQPGTSFEDTIRFLVMRGEYGPLSDPEAMIAERVEQARTFRAHYMERTRANGRTIAVEGAPLPQGGWVTVYTDITDIKAQEALLHARSEVLSSQLLAHAERLAQANRELAATNAALEEAKRELTEIEARTRQVTEMMPAHIAHMDRDFHYTYSNRQLTAVMPGSLSEIVGRPAIEALGADTFHRIEPGLRRALEGEANVIEISHTPSGRRIRIALTPDRVGEGAVNGVYILSTDVTGEAQARAALAQSAKRELAAQLTSGLAHDFANLLTIILGLQGRLERSPGLGPEALELVRATLAAARRGGTLLDRIAAISGPRALRPQPTDLRAFLADLVAMAAPTLGDGVQVRQDVQGLDGPLLLDPGPLQDSLLNLMLNARDAMAGRGAITIAAHPVRDTWVEIAVADSGPGFSPEALDHALDPFFTTKGGEGSGLGLSMVYDQTKLAGGTVSLANAPGGGAEVTLRLPLRPAEPPPPEMLVLLVEDNEDIRQNVREMLCEMGHSVLETTSAAEALDLAAVANPGFVLSDIQLAGGLTGLTLLEALEAGGIACGRGLMTSLPAGHPLRARAPCPVISKPFGPAELASLLAAGANR